MCFYIAVTILLLLYFQESACQIINKDDGILFDYYGEKRRILLNNNKNVKIMSETVQDKMDSIFACVNVPWCRSVNFQTTPLASGLHLCELVSLDQSNSTKNLTESKEFLHYSLKSPCKENSCLNGAECVALHNSREGYRCNCKHGFEGLQCERDIDECSNGQYLCHENANCFNNAGSYTCTCKPGYQGNGSSCTAIPFAARFTNLGATGRLGPTSLGSHYTSKDHDGQVTLSSGIQIWTVPYTAKYRIEAVGASGGYDTCANSKSYRGRGARMVGTFTLNRGDLIKILVGQAGLASNVHCSTGGGGSFVVKYDNTTLIIAGGGGGITCSGKHYSNSDASSSTTGNSGYGGSQWAGGKNGNGATTADSGSSGGGGGGFYTSGRSSTTFGGAYGTGGEGGKGFLQGGAGGRTLEGGFGGGGGASGHDHGAGGGGGYSGGASGDNGHNTAGGGGSFNSGSVQSNYCCYNNQGHGYVVVTKL